MRSLLFAASIVFSSCASSILADDPTPERPIRACIAPTPNQRIRVEGKLLPEQVLLIGRTSEADGSRWMVLRGVETDIRECRKNVNDRRRCPWLPYPQETITRINCGPEFAAYSAIERRE